MEDETGFHLRESDREQLERLRRRPGTARKLCLRADILLAADVGMGVRRSARELKTTTPTVMLWKGRYAAGGLAAVLKEAPRPGRPRQVTAEKVAEVIERTTREKPAGATHWSTRTMAKAQGLSQPTIHRIWKRHRLQPHRVETFKLSRDPQFVENLIKALGGGIAFMLDPANKAKAIASIADMLKMKDPKKLENAYQEAFETFRRKPYPNMEGVKFQLKLIADMKSHPGVEKLKGEDVVDDRFVKKLDQSGFFDQLPKGR